ncbi:NAD(P)H-hydrate dehydratase [Nocardioides bizhenqiangii]|uniref:ADP-dependent (S)-NAD(P)H-hydrate dehydratase n=1 Tax=Nocardioides bizhenqiangii TaxID=3095076 RepID=A0ABZ0ZRF5_9ACTN|nr:NAD(P)H-hydrate dehydratase [Nocardioides sp. HM61]WQQ26356.1 NAD(P)H-hydrate dehydratase [Nocardioides sp. HM61]
MTAQVHVTPATLHGWPLPAPASDKHGRGVVLVVGGSAGTPGAVRLAAEAALRVGCGKVRIATASSAASRLAALVPEARVYALEETADGDLAAENGPRIAALAEDVDATLIGCGFVDPAASDALLGAAFPDLRGPVVLDALASAYVAGHPELGDVQGPSILTMNPNELAHVLHRDAAEVAGEPGRAVAEQVSASGAVVLLGGETKLVGVAGGPTYEVTGGGPGLATAGSGDVQAGLVAGLLARGADPDQAAVWGAWLHATAGERAAARRGSLGFLARELAPEVPALLDEVAG